MYEYLYENGTYGKRKRETSVCFLQTEIENANLFSVAGNDKW
jgi:hypothetical protein